VIAAILVALAIAAPPATSTSSTGATPASSSTVAPKRLELEHLRIDYARCRDDRADLERDHVELLRSLDTITASTSSSLLDYCPLGAAIAGLAGGACALASDRLGSEPARDACVVGALITSAAGLACEIIR
jgi:hypothetical protein